MTVISNVLSLFEHNLHSHHTLSFKSIVALCLSTMDLIRPYNLVHHHASNIFGAFLSFFSMHNGMSLISYFGEVVPSSAALFHPI